MKTFVKQSKRNYIKLNYLFPIFTLIVILIIALNPQKYSIVAFNGIEVWAKVLVPALFPFFVLTKLFSATNFLDDFTLIFKKPVKKLYNCPPCSSYIFFMSIITGYPVGAKLVSEFYNSGNLTKSEAIRTMSFCANSGPMFILGSVAIGMFSSPRMGYIMLISHIIGSLINGFLYRNIRLSDEPKNKANVVKPSITFSESITSSISSILLIGGVICFTFVLIEVIISSPIFTFIVHMLGKLGINEKILTAILCGIGEITKGCLMFSSIAINPTLTTTLCTFLISFGGVSTMLQAMAFTKDIVPTKTFILQKITHAFCASVVCLMIGCILF